MIARFNRTTRTTRKIGCEHQPNRKESLIRIKGNRLTGDNSENGCKRFNRDFDMKMNFRAGMLLLVVASLKLLGSVGTVDAQWKPLSQPSQKFFRLAGHGFSAGYHWRTPGHQSDYYHPYSFQNTHRIGDPYNTGSSRASAYGFHRYGPTANQFEQAPPEKRDSALGDSTVPSAEGDDRGNDIGAGRRPTPPSRPRLPVRPNNPWPFDFD